MKAPPRGTHRIGSLVLIGGLAGLFACSDGTQDLVAPSRSAAGALNTQVYAAVDAAGDGGPEIVVLHGTHHATYVYAIRGNEVTNPHGDTHTATAADIARLRKWGGADKRVESLKKIFKPEWDRLGLMDVDEASVGEVQRRRFHQVLSPRWSGRAIGEAAARTPT